MVEECKLNEEKKIMNKIVNIILSLKPIPIILICIMGSMKAGSFVSYLFPILEVIIVFIVTAQITKKSKIVSYIFNCLLCLIIMMQQCLLYFSGEYASPILLENLSSFSALGDSGSLYKIIITLVILIALFPWKPLTIKSKSYSLSLKVSLICFVIYIAIVASMIAVTSTIPSPVASLGKTISTLVSTEIKVKKLENLDVEEVKPMFYSEIIEQGVERCKTLPDKPNIILIFAEGMSAEVIDRYRPDNQVEGLTLTPNINKFYDKSIVFENYSNHTAATYRGLWSQLFSGYLLNAGRGANADGFQDVDANIVKSMIESEMIALPDVLRAQSYNSFMLNTEPENTQFTSFLDQLHFDKVVTADDHSRSMSDKEAFELFLDAITSQNEPFFASMYTVATHHGFDSPDKKYKDGDDAVLNRFHNFDEQFGKFIDEFMKTDMAKDTIIILSTDHASYHSPEYLSALNSTADSFIGKIPLLIYWDGVEHEIIDVYGRNSLNLTPTILDLIDVEYSPNYFLGTSLFITEEDNPFDKISALGTIYYTTDELYPPRNFDPNEKAYSDTVFRIEEYYAISLKNRLTQ